MNQVDTHMFPTNFIDVIISPLGLKRFDLIPEGIHHRPRLLYSALNLIL